MLAVWVPWIFMDFIWMTRWLTGKIEDAKTEDESRTAQIWNHFDLTLFFQVLYDFYPSVMDSQSPGQPSGDRSEGNGAYHRGWLLRSLQMTKLWPASVCEMWAIGFWSRTAKDLPCQCNWNSKDSVGRSPSNIPSLFRGIFVGQNGANDFHIPPYKGHTIQGQCEL